MDTYRYIDELFIKAGIAQKEAEQYSQEKVDELVRSIAWSVVKNENARNLALMSYQETGMGDIDSKFLKIQKKTKGVLRDILPEKTVGVIEEDKQKGLIKIAKPVGVIGALIPCTNPEITPITKALFAIKGRNAIIFSPHPRGIKTTLATSELMREALNKHGAPKDLILCPENINIEVSNYIMKNADLVIATGGTNMVKAAYSSGTPSYGVGAGNSVVVIDETADIKDAAHKIMLSKTFDLAAGCSCENSLIINNDIYEDMINALINEGGQLVSLEEKDRLADALWPDGQHLNKDIIAQPASRIADMAGISIHKDKTFLIVEEEGIGRDYLFSGEKLCVVLTVYRYSDFNEAIEMVNTIQHYQGTGHSCGIHSFDGKHIMDFAMKTYTSRVMVRQPMNYGNSGDWANGMPFTVTLGCGTWGGNIVTENIHLKHYINTTWVSNPIKPIIPSDKELFGEIMSTD